jgi:imidazolonepropionase-like amidohydrolase
MTRRTILLFLIFSTFAIAQKGDDVLMKSEPLTAITHVTVIDVKSGTALTDQTVIITGAKITEVGNALKVSVPKDASKVDGQGKYLIPGLWDMHVHMAGITADPHWSQPLLGVMLANGITGMRDMGGNLPDLQNWRSEIEAGRMAGPRIVASGPMLDGTENHMPTSLAANTPFIARNNAAAARNMGADFIKILNNIPKDAYLEIATFSKELKIPFVGHIPPEVSAAEASDAGQKSIEHLEGIQLGCSDKEEELRKAMLEARKAKDQTAFSKAREEAIATFNQKKCEVLFAKFKENGTWQVPTQVWTRAFATMDKADPKDTDLKYLPESVTNEWTTEKLNKDVPEAARKIYSTRFEQGKKYIKLLNAQGVGLLAGSDSIDPYVFTGTALHEELALFTEEGLTSAEALRTATLNPAKFFGRDDLGSIQSGKLADMVLLSADPLKDIHNTRKIESVWTNGRFFNRAALDKMLDDAKRAAASYKP